MMVSTAHPQRIPCGLELLFASNNNIKDASSVIDEVCGHAARWSDIAKDCDVPSEMIKAIMPNMLLAL